MKFLRELLNEHEFTWHDIETALIDEEEMDNDRFSYGEMWDAIGYAIEEKHPGTFDQDVLRYRHHHGPDLSTQAAEYVADVFKQKGMTGVRELLSNMKLLEHVTKNKKSICS